MAELRERRGQQASYFSLSASDDDVSEKPPEKYWTEFHLFPEKETSVFPERSVSLHVYTPIFDNQRCLCFGNVNMASQFVPRAAFPTLNSLPKSYFLGHHRAGLAKMKTKLSNVDIIIECRDYRVPFTSRNPLFEESLVGRNRAFIYTKRDLGSTDSACDREVCSLDSYYHLLMILNGV